MLAWVHQSIAAEREFLESLFGLKSDGRMVGSVRDFTTRGEEEDWIRELMDLALGKLCVPLKVGFIRFFLVALPSGCLLLIDHLFEIDACSANDKIAREQHCFV